LHGQGNRSQQRATRESLVLVVGSGSANRISSLYPNMHEQACSRAGATLRARHGKAGTRTYAETPSGLGFMNEARTVGCHK
jgi:hypothetical protein